MICLEDRQSLSKTSALFKMHGARQAHCQRPPLVQAAVQAWRYRDTLQKIEFAAVISGSNNDDAAWKQWTEAAANETRIKRFKKPLFHAKPEKTDPLAFLVVKSMLLNGFDAPIEGVMYLDRPIREAELLQAIARVNRTGFGKRCGIVAGYCGAAEHLREALAAYADEDIQRALQSLKDEVPALRLVEDQEVPLKLLNGRFLLRRNLVASARVCLVQWYSARAKVSLWDHAREYVARMEVQPVGVKVQDLGYRWGSCGKGDGLYFHWKTILLPPRIAEYVVVHELAHLYHPHHTPAFWQWVERALPNFERRKTWLAEHGMEVEGL